MEKAGIQRRRCWKAKTLGCFKAKTLGPGVRRDDEELSVLRLSVIPANAGILLFWLHCRDNVNVDPSVRWDDGNGR